LELYQQGDILGAMNDLSRALLMDPDDKEAYEALIHMSSLQRLTAKQKINLLFFEDLVSQRQNLLNKIDYYQSKKAALENTLIKSGMRRAFIDENLLSITKEIEGFAQRTFKNARRDSSKQQDPLAVVIDSVAFEKDRLSEKVLIHSRQYDRLKDLQKDFQGHDRSVASLKSFRDNIGGTSRPRTHYQNVRNYRPILSIPPDTQNDHLRDDIAGETNPEIDLVKRHMALIHRRLYGLKKILDEKEQHMNKLTKELIDHALQLSEKDRLLSKKNEELASLNKEFVDIRSRFDLGQRILQEKNDQIQSLQGTIEDFRSAASTENKKKDDFLAKKDEQLIELNGILRIYRLKLADATGMNKEKTATISTLEEQLTLAQTKIFQRGDALQETRDNFVSLENQLNDIQEKLIALENRETQHQAKSPWEEQELADLRSRLKDIHQYLQMSLTDFEKFNGYLPVDDLQEIDEFLNHEESY